MLTDDKKITTPEYWDRVYSGNNHGPVDSSNTVRTNPFDRFAVVVDNVWGEKILDVGSGHGHICKRIKARYPASTVIASDQAPEAKKVSSYEPYIICSGYDLPFANKSMDLVICTQAMEYMDDHERFIAEAKRVATKLLITVPNGEMSNWSQLRIYTRENLIELLSKFGTIELIEEFPSMFMAKVKFYD